MVSREDLREKGQKPEKFIQRAAKQASEPTRANQNQLQPLTHASNDRQTSETRETESRYGQGFAAAAAAAEEQSKQTRRYVQVMFLGELERPL